MGPLSSIHPVIVLAFSPVTTIGSIVVRWETLAAAAAILVVLVVAALVARRTPVDLSLPPDAPSPDPDDDGSNHLRADDLLYIAVAAIPGAVIGGRIGYGLTHLAYYQANSGALVDITQGGLQLSLGVVGGLLTASVVAALLGAPVGRWLHALALPLMLALTGGQGGDDPRRQRTGRPVRALVGHRVPRCRAMGVARAPPSRPGRRRRARRSPRSWWAGSSGG